MAVRFRLSGDDKEACLTLGARTPLASILAHVIYGGILGYFYQA
jgi:hypothetical protein